MAVKSVGWRFLLLRWLFLDVDEIEVFFSWALELRGKKRKFLDWAKSDVANFGPKRIHSSNRNDKQQNNYRAATEEEMATC